MNTTFLEKYYERCFDEGQTIEWNKELFTSSILQVGKLSLPSGLIVVCDPFIKAISRPFIQGVPPGQYPVDLCLVRRENSNVERIAMARIMITRRKPVVWVSVACAIWAPDQVRFGKFGWPNNTDPGCGGRLFAALRPELRSQSYRHHHGGRLLPDGETGFGEGPDERNEKRQPRV